MQRKGKSLDLESIEKIASHEIRELERLIETKLMENGCSMGTKIPGSISSFSIALDDKSDQEIERAIAMIMKRTTTTHTIHLSGIKIISMSSSTGSRLSSLVLQYTAQLD